MGAGGPYAEAWGPDRFGDPCRRIIERDGFAGKSNFLQGHHNLFPNRGFLAGYARNRQKTDEAIDGGLAIELECGFSHEWAGAEEVVSRR